MEKNFERGWAIAALRGLSHCSPEVWRACLEPCADHHYESDGISAAVALHRGDLEGFLAFAEAEYGWKCHLDREARRLSIDENKNVCACPLARGGETPPDILCNCSVLFFTRIFSELLQTPVTARVAASVLRGDASCVYEISLPE
ncbi:MAG: hypothetical protein PHD67_11100 [Oscillospiraceae bacterium]|nr:hypothetical protein [Oscillospiraceae bacterium]